MSRIRFPEYYKNFKCIGGPCTDNCCIGWEVDIDEDTLAFYRSVKDFNPEFGARLEEYICEPASDSSAEDNAENFAVAKNTAESAAVAKDNVESSAVAYDTENPLPHFIMGKDSRCPFLNDCNLCDIILELGEEHISQICTDHPRYYDWLTDATEAGVGLVCEEAARLILTSAGNLMEEYSEDSSEDPEDSDENPEDSEVSADAEIPVEETVLLEMRDRLLRIIDGEAGSPSYADLLSDLYNTALEMQTEYEEIVYPEFPHFEAETDTSFDWISSLWSESLLSEISKRLCGFPTNRPEWHDYIRKLQKSLPELIASREAFEAAFPETELHYRRLLRYFIYRHFMKARFDDLVFEKVVFALLSVSFIELMDINGWLESGSFTLTDQINICKAFSREIEYNEGNTVEFSLFLSE